MGKNICRCIRIYNLRCVHLLNTRIGYPVKYAQNFVELCIGLVISCHQMLIVPLQCRHNGRDGVSNHQPHDCLLNRSFRHKSKKTSKLRVTGRCEGNSPVTSEFPAQMASNAENVSICWPSSCHVTQIITHISKDCFTGLFHWHWGIKY